MAISAHPGSKQTFIHFSRLIETATSAEQCWDALRKLFADGVGCKLFTVMTVDMKHELARRAYSSNRDAYPVSGTKPIHYDAWFDVVHRQKRSFVANTINEIAAVFPDHEKIRLLGCGSVVNLPLIVKGELVATINVLDVERHFTPERVSYIDAELAAPSLLAYQKANGLISDPPTI